MSARLIYLFVLSHTAQIAKLQAIKSPAKKAGLLGYSLFRSLAIRASGNQGLARAVDDRLQRFGAGVLVRIQAFAVTSDTVFVDQGEAEAAFASGHDQAVHRCEGVGQGANSVLGMDLSRHNY